MTVPIDLVLQIFIIICAVASVVVRDLLSAAMILGAYSFFMCIMWAQMGAVDVAFTEASVSAGIGTILFVAAVMKTTRRTKD